MSDEDRGFKIRDRRRFDADGNPREVEDEAGASEAPASETPASETPPADAAASSTSDEARGSLRTVDFSSFVLSIATNAIMMLQGGGDEEHVPGARVDLQVAAQHIDILAMLQEKTSGNLSKDETDILQSVLYDLRMNYLQAAQEQPASK